MRLKKPSGFKKKKYSTRILLMNAMVFSLLIIFYGIITFISTYRSQRLAFLKPYEESLTELYNAYTNKHENFYNLM
ncbi:hypothetical protein FACS1894141_1980 [Spirochaetia bacterium]|nr:hypothetical protein FACS1894141_1980 [Spirochaetia bacterium]